VVLAAKVLHSESCLRIYREAKVVNLKVEDQKSLHCVVMPAVLKKSSFQMECIPARSVMKFTTAAWNVSNGIGKEENIEITVLDYKMKQSPQVKKNRFIVVSLVWMPLKVSPRR